MASPCNYNVAYLVDDSCSYVRYSPERPNTPPLPYSERALVPYLPIRNSTCRGTTLLWDSSAYKCVRSVACTRDVCLIHMALAWCFNSHADKSCYLALTRRRQYEYRSLTITLHPAFYLCGYCSTRRRCLNLMLQLRLAIRVVVFLLKTLEGLFCLGGLHSSSQQYIPSHRIVTKTLFGSSPSDLNFSLPSNRSLVPSLSMIEAT